MSVNVGRRLKQVMSKKASEPVAMPDKVPRKVAAPIRPMLPPPSEPRVKALTVKLTQRDYERLLRAGLSPRRTNQDMSEEAILMWLDTYEAGGR